MTLDTFYPTFLNIVMAATAPINDEERDIARELIAITDPIISSGRNSDSFNNPCREFYELSLLSPELLTRDTRVLHL